MSDDYELMEEASKVIGMTLWEGSEVPWDRFVHNSLQWLAVKLGDVHLEFLKGEDWQVGTCHEGEMWEGWIQGKTLVEALAKTVICVGRIENDHPRTEK